MKNIFLYLIFFLIIGGCHKTNEPRTDILNISGLVTNKHSNTPIDSAAIILKHSLNFSFLTDTLIYTDINGKFNLQFSPQDNKTYSLQINKDEFNSTFVSINIDKEFQYFNIALDTL